MQCGQQMATHALRFVSYTKLHSRYVVLNDRHGLWTSALPRQLCPVHLSARMRKRSSTARESVTHMCYCPMPVIIAPRNISCTPRLMPELQSVIINLLFCLIVKSKNVVLNCPSFQLCGTTLPYILIATSTLVILSTLT